MNELSEMLFLNCKITKVNLEEKCYVDRRRGVSISGKWRVHLGDGKERLSRVP